MDKRQQELRKIQKYIDDVDKETTLLLQSLQWDKKHLLESPAMVSCKYVSDHKVPLHSREAHEKQCYLAHLGYSKEEVLLPDLIYPSAETVVKLSCQDIMNIINTAAASDPAFKRGVGSSGAEPLSWSRLQLAYTADERRAIHDAVVAAAPADHGLADLALPSSSSGRQTAAKSHAEVLAELRDMKRRRARYRVAANTTRYSDVLRDVIKTQMELYAEAKGIFIKTEYGPKSYVSLQDKSAENITDIVIKQERISPDNDYNKERSRRYKERSRSRDRRRRTEHDDRETSSSSSSRKRHHYHNEEDNPMHKRRSKDVSQDGFSKERQRYYDESHFNQDKYSRSNDSSEHKYDDRYQRRESSSRKKSEKYDDRKKIKYNNDYDLPKTSKYDSSSKEHDRHRNHGDGSSNGSKSDYKRKHDEYEKHTHSYVRREHKHREHDRIKKEKDDYDDDRKSRKRHA